METYSSLCGYNTRTIVKCFQRWGDEEIRSKQQPGLCFQDAFISTVDGQPQQLQKDARHGCYVAIPTSISQTPSMDTRRRYASILLSSFAGSAGLQVLLNQCALVVARVRQPDVLHIVVGCGHDGKTLIFVDHMQAVFGSAFSCAPCSMLQADREFQVQGVNFIHSSFLTFDECKRDQGIMEDTVKVFVGGGWLPLRRNHEAETKYGHWAHSAKVWAMNVGDTPRVPTAEEVSHQRRFRCTYMRSKFTAIQDEVDVANKVFQADPSAKEFMASGAAVWCFFQDFLFPHLRSNGLQKCSDNLQYLMPETTLYKDTHWLLQKMSRCSERPNPDEGQGPAHPEIPVAQSRSERIIRETHAAVTTQFFSAKEVNRLLAPSNPGSAPPKKPGKKLRVEYLKESILEFPHLIRSVDGQVRAGNALDRFERRCLNVDAWQTCLQTCLGEARVEEIAGTWQDWSWPQAAEASLADTMDDPTGLPRGDSWTISCNINLEGLKQYAASTLGEKGLHARQVAEICERDNETVGDLVTVKTTGHQKTVAGESLGRVFFPWVSFPTLSRSARSYGSPLGTKEFDMPNAVIHFALKFAEEYAMDLPCFRRYHAFKAEWRQVVMSWFSFSEHDAKKALLMASFGFAFPSRASGSPVACPLLEGLAADAMKLREVLCQKFPSVVQDMKAAKRPRPETSAMAFLLFDKEHKAMQLFCGLLPKHGFALVAPVFDAVLAVPQANLSMPGEEVDSAASEQALLEDFHSQTGIMMQVKPLDRSPPMLTVQQILESILENNAGIRMGAIHHIPGCYSCIGTALLNLFPEEADPLKAATSNLPEPMSYQHMMQLCPQFSIEPVSLSQAEQCGDGMCFLLHASSSSAKDCGHAYGLKLVQEAAHIYSSAEEECIQTNAKKLWKHLSKAHGTQVFQVNVLSADDRAAKRRRKEAPSTCLEVQLKAGMEAEEGWSSVAPQVRACMEREVLQEITRLGLSQ